MSNSTCSDSQVSQITLQILNILGIVLMMILYISTKYKRIISMLGIRKYDPAAETANKVAIELNVHELHGKLERMETVTRQLQEMVIGYIYRVNHPPPPPPGKTKSYSYGTAGYTDPKDEYIPTGKVANHLNPGERRTWHEDLSGFQMPMMLADQVVRL